MAGPRFLSIALASAVACLAVLAAAEPGLAVTPVAWPVSSDVLLAEVMTGGASASDEFVEIANAGDRAADLAGLEVVYITASGSTVTRKASFGASLALVPGQHLLLANSAGIYGPLADVTYSGGLASDGGSLAIRRTDDSGVIDAVGWGTAANSFVEGTAAPAPPAKSSLERLPGGGEGNWLDTNDNRADWMIQSAPRPQSLLSAPVPRPTAGATGSAGATATLATAAPSPVSGETPSLAATPQPSPEASSPAASLPSTPAQTATEAPSPPVVTATATAGATATPVVIATATPSVTATAAPTPTPTPTPGSTPTSGPTAEPTRASPLPIPIPSARALPDGSTATVEGVLTTRLGVLEGGRGAFLQDGGGGIALYFAEVPASALPAGTRLRATGTLDDRYGQRTLRLDGTDASAVGESGLPDPVRVATGAAGPSEEGLLLAVSGTVTATPDSLADGTGLWLDDGSGPLRIVVTPSALAGLTPSELAKGARLRVAGPLGQRTSGSSAGYRIEVTEPGWIVVLAAPSPSPARSASGTSGSPRPGSSGGTSPLPTGAEVSSVSIATARKLPPGSRVRLSGILTSAPGATGSPDLVSMQDSSGGIFVRLAASPEGLVPGRSVEVVGILAAPYGQLEVRDLERITPGSDGDPPAPLWIRPSELAEPVEGSLVMTRGTVDSVRTESGRLTLAIGDGALEVRVLADPATGLTSEDVSRGESVAVIGVVGQRASATGAADGFRIWLRGRDDLIVLADAPRGETPGSTPLASAVHEDNTASTRPRVSIADLGAHLGGRVTVSGLVVEVGSGRATIADATGRVRIGGTAASVQLSLLEPGDAVEFAGLVTADGQEILIEVDPLTLVCLPHGLDPASIVPRQASSAPAGSSFDPGRAARFAGQGGVAAIGGAGLIGPALLVVVALGVLGLATLRLRVPHAGLAGSPQRPLAPPEWHPPEGDDGSISAELWSDRA